MRLFVLGLLLIAAAPGWAQVGCKENVMTAAKFCSSRPAYSGGNYYFFATDDPGENARIVFNFRGLVSSARPDSMMVKLDAGTPFKVDASHLRPDVDCRRSDCRWTVSAIAKFTDAQFVEIAAAQKMLVSFVEGAYVSDPMEVDPQQIKKWLEDWHALTGRGPGAFGSPDTPVPPAAGGSAT